MKRESSVASASSKRLKAGQASAQANTLLNYFKTSSTSIKCEKNDEIKIECTIIREDIKLEASIKQEASTESQPKSDDKSFWQSLFARPKPAETKPKVEVKVKKEESIKENDDDEKEADVKEPKTYRKCPFYKFISSKHQILHLTKKQI